MRSSSDFPYCHPEIASTLALEQTEDSKSDKSYLSSDGERFVINFPVSSTIDDLIGFAIECEDVVFQSNMCCPAITQCSPFLQSLVEFSRSSSRKNTAPTTTATLLALNFLESGIRCSTGYTTGRAPLLKTMISEIADTGLRQALQLLLLPTGLNLRNLVWHGFVPYLPQHWLAVVVVLATTLHHHDHDKLLSVQCSLEELGLKEVTELEPLLLYNLDMARTTEAVLSWLPNSHHHMWHLAMEWYQAKLKPISTMAILIILMEHGLRLEWCHLNKQQDNIAVPERYYVTLDGFGQRTLHNILMHPYLLDERGESRRNALMDYLPGSTTALITDLFCSPCGPNIRALVSHGNLDNLLFQEWQNKSDSLDDADYQWQMTHAVLVGLYLVASREQIDYRPVFSFAAISQERVDRTQDQIEVLCQMNKKCKQQYPALRAFLDDINAFDVALEGFTDTKLMPTKTSWTTDDVFSEFEANLKLVNSGAARMLLKDVEIATAKHIGELKEAIQILEGSAAVVDKRKKKRSLRIIESTYSAYSLYRFGMCVAFLYLKEQLTETNHDEQLGLSIRAVERLRMVVSTFDNFLHSNTERAMKSLREYSKAKKTKDVATKVHRAIAQSEQRR